MSQFKPARYDIGTSTPIVESVILLAEQAEGVALRAARAQDLEGINRVIAAAMDCWRISDRVKRISLPLYQYQAEDMDFLQIFVAENAEAELLGVAALEEGDSMDEPSDPGLISLHGIYVDPAFHGRSVGASLLGQVERIAFLQGYRVMTVKAKADSTGFFTGQGYEKLPVRDPHRDYPYRFRKLLDSQLTV